MGSESLLHARKPSFWLSKQAIDEDVLLRHTPSVARACTLRSTHHTQSHISCIISKFKKTLLTLSSLVLLFFQNVLSRQCQTELGEDDVCDATGLRGIPWEWALVLPPPIPLFCCAPHLEGKVGSPKLVFAPIAISLRKDGASGDPIRALLNRTRLKNRLRRWANEGKSEHAPQPVEEHRGQTQTPPTHARR